MPKSTGTNNDSRFFTTQKKGEMHGWAIGMCKNGDGEGGGKDFKLRCLFAKASVSESDVFSYTNINRSFRVLFSPAGLEAYDRCVQTVRVRKEIEPHD